MRAGLRLASVRARSSVWPRKISVAVFFSPRANSSASRSKSRVERSNSRFMSSPVGTGAPIAVPEIASSIKPLDFRDGREHGLGRLLAGERADHLGQDLEHDHVAAKFVRRRIGQNRAEQVPGVADEPQEGALVLVAPKQVFRRLLQRRLPLEARHGEHVRRPNRSRLRVDDGAAERGPQRLDELVLALDRVGHHAGTRLGVDRQRLFQVAEHADVIDDEARLLARRDAVRARDRLHQRVVLHRLVEVDVEQVGTSKPVIHMAQTKTSRSGSSGVLELLVHVLVDHAPAMRLDVEPLLGHQARFRSATG